MANIEEILAKGKSVSPEEIAGKGRVVQQEPQRASTFQDLRSDIQKRGQQFSELSERSAQGQQTPLETGLQGAGTVVGAGFDIAGRGLQGAFRALPDFIENPIRGAAKGISGTILETEVGRQALGAMKEGFESYQMWKDDHPRAAANVESVVNIGSLFPIGAGGRAAAPAIGKTAGAGAEVLEQSLKKQATQEAIEITRPTLKSAERIAALEAGRAAETGFGLSRRIDIAPSPKDLQVARAVEDVVSPKKANIDNIAAIRDKIEIVSEEVGEGLKKNNSIFNKQELRSVLNNAKEESKVVFAADATEERAYNAVIDEMIKIVDTRKKTVAELWESRKEFDKVMESKFPKVFDKFAGDNVRSNAILDVRRAVNDFIETRTPDTNPFKSRLKEISNMYQANKNIARSTQALVGKTRAQRALDSFKRNQAVYFATGGILTFGAVMGVLTNPIVLGSVLLGGTIKVGKNIVTAKSLRSSMAKMLRQIEKRTPKNNKAVIQLNRDKEAIQNVIDDIDNVSDSTP